MTVYIGSGPYCYANSLAMVLGPDAPTPSQIEVLTGSPFGFVLLAGRRPFFDPYGWDPGLGLDDALELLGWDCRCVGAAGDGSDDAGTDGAAAMAALREALRSGPVLVGPMEMGLLRHHPEMSGGHPIGSDHFVMAIDVSDDLVRFHDPQGVPYATLPTDQFLAAWRAETIDYPHPPYTMRYDLRRARETSVADAMRSAVPGWRAWLRGRDELPMPPGSLAGADGVHRLASMVTDELPADLHNHLVYFAIRVGARRLSDAADALADLGYDKAASVATRQARLVGSLQYDIVMGRRDEAARTLRDLAPTYDELVDALA